MTQKTQDFKQHLTRLVTCVFRY